MRELEFAGHPSLDAARPPRPGLRLSRTAFVASIAAHVVAALFLIQQRWGSVPTPPASADFFLFELPAPVTSPVAETASAAAPVTPVEERAPAPEPVPAPVEEQVPAPAPRATEVAPPPEAVVVEPAPGGELAPPNERAPVTAPVPAPFVDLEEARRRAAREVIEAGAAQSAYMTFSLDDVAPPRPEEPDEPERSIFDDTGGSRGPSVGQLGQSRTKFGHRVASLCNALTGGFSLMGWGSFCGGPPDGSPSGLFPEVRPPYLDMMPECVDTRDTAPALALEAPFPTVKCRLVEQPEFEELP